MNGYAFLTARSPLTILGVFSVLETVSSVDSNSVGTDGLQQRIAYIERAEGTENRQNSEQAVKPLRID